MSERFKTLRGIVLAYLEGESQYSESKILKVIENSYQEDLIEGQEYDYLMNLMDR